VIESSREGVGEPLAVWSGWWRSIPHYAKIWRVFLLNSLTLEVEYRTAFLAEVVLSITALGWKVTSIWVFFVHRERIGTWSLWEAMIVLGLFTFFDGVLEMFFRPNLERIIEHIRMDFVLTKPVNAQFLATLRFARFRFIGDVSLGLGLAVYSLWRLGIQPPWLSVLLFVGLLAAGTAILYSILLVLVTLAFWFVNVTNIIELIWSVFEAGRVPVDVFPGAIRAFLTFVVPVAFITTVPAEALLGRVTPRFASLSLLMAAIALTTSSLFWNYAIRHYSSASS